jgi:uncharacterized protein YgiM (DUF1202 family)
MNPFRRVLILITLPAFLLASCNLPASIQADEPSADQIEQLALTIVVQTQQAQAALATEPPHAPTDAPAQQGTFVSVSTATNCRTGPDINYSLVLTFQPGATAEVVGKYSPSNYWIINTPTGGTCWLWGAYASVTGDTSILPEIAAPPPPVAAVQPTEEPPSGGGGDGDDGGDGGGGVAVATLGPLVLNPGMIQLLLVPLPPASFSATANCNYITFPAKLLIGKTDKLSWSSVSNATGYYVYVNGLQIKDTASTTTSVDALAMSASNYGVASYNSKGTSTVKTISAPSCP